MNLAINVNSLQSFLDSVKAYFLDPDRLMAAFMIMIKIVLIYMAARILIRILTKVISHMVHVQKQSRINFDTRRTNTLGKLANNVITYTINFIAILLILGQLGLNLGPLLAGAGVLGLAIGFGAQSLVKDVITGFFIIFEDQFAVGDIVQIDNFRGTVEQIGIRVTKLKSWTGEVHFIPNGTITKVTNYSIYNSLAVIDVSISYESDTEKAIEVLNGLVKEIYEKNENVLTEPQVLGVQELGPSEVKLRLTAECVPNTQAAVTREIFMEVKRRFDEHEIEIPYPKSVTYIKGERVAQ